MARLPGVALLIGLTVILSGCAGGRPGASPQAQNEPMAPTVSDETGAIAGVVTSVDLQPIPGAQVALKDGQADPEVTDAAGRFSFSYLPPGKHTLFAVALGYASGAKSVDVTAGEVAEVRFQLEPIGAGTPFSVLEVKTGLISCGTGTPAVTQVACGAADPNQRFLFGFRIRENVSALLVEQVWRPTQALSRDLLLIAEKDGCGFSCEQADTFAQVQGCCYLRIVLNESQLKLPAGTRPALDLPTDGGTLQTRTFPSFGESQAPATVFVQQEFTLYVEHFYDGVPSDWETRTNVPAG